jgi:exopolysaccharide biosynthesis protein
MTAWLLAAALSTSIAAASRSPWKQIAPGVENATVADLGGDANWAAKVVFVDPQLVQFAVRFDAAKPTLKEWRTRFPSAIAIINGSFYSSDAAEIRPTCEIVQEGKRMRGAGCQRQDALFFGAHAKNVPPVVASIGPTRPVSAKAAPRFLVPNAFRAEDWTEALKSFPALVHEGNPACKGPHYCAESSRTAAVGQLRDGRILLFASQWPAIRREVGKWLSDALGATEVLNLDGGPEATLALHGEPVEDTIGTNGRGLPLVLVVLPP